MSLKARLKDLKTTSLSERLDEDINHAVLDVITPMENFDFAPKRTDVEGKVHLDPHLLKAGPYFRQILGCKSYPTKVGLNWLSPLFTDPHVIATIACEPYSKTKISKDIDTDDDRVKTELRATNKSSKEGELQSKLNHSKTMLELLGDEDERFFRTTIFGQVFDTDDVELRQRVSDFTDTMASASSISVGTISHNQRPAFFAASPLMRYDKTTADQCARPVPVSSIGAALPFSKAGLDDGCGITIGHDDSGALVRLNLMEPSDTRTNRNIVVLGKPGVGKTTLTLKLLVNLVAEGTTVIMIDPEREYRYACEMLHGQWINLGGHSNFNICPTAPRAMSTDDDDKDRDELYLETQNNEVLTETVSVLRTFFTMAFDCSRREIDYLEKVLKDVYARFNITYETPLKEIDMNHYPLMKDILDEVLARAEKAKGKAKEDLETLAGKIWPAVEGSLSSLWSKPTNVKARSNFIVLDTHDLNNRDDAIKAAQYFNVLTWVWDQICQARITGNKILFGIDEAHMVLGNDMQSSAQKVGQISRRIRKYFGGLLTATHQVKDLAYGPGEEILDMAAYRFLLANDGKNLKEEMRIFGLTDDVTLRLEKARRGQGVVMAGSEKVWIEVDVLPYERSYVFRDEKVG